MKAKFAQHQYLLAGWCLAIVFVLMISGCSPAKVEVDRSFVTGQPCAAPCWYGLEPDKSKMEDVYATLKSLPFVDISTIETSIMPRDGIEVTYKCPGIDRPYCGRAIFYDSILRDLQVPIPHNLTLSIAVDRLGPPDYIVYDKYFPVNSCSIELYWSEKGVQVTSFDSDSIIRCQAVAAKQGLDPDARVSSVLYYSTQDEFEVNCCGEMSDVRIPWPGFTK